MKKILEAISEEMKKAFAGAGYEEELGKVTPVSYTHLEPAFCRPAGGV